MWSTLINMNKLNFQFGSSFYNPEIVLSILYSTVKAGSDVIILFNISFFSTH